MAERLTPVFTKFSKGVIVALLIGLIISKLYEIRKLLYIQAASVAGVAAASVLSHKTYGGRLYGIQKGILENPNDLAIAIAINFPLCVAFMFGAKGGFRKVLWAVGMVFMMYCVLITYSRSGMIALVITCVICLWEYGVKQKRTLLLFGAGAIRRGGIRRCANDTTLHRRGCSRAWCRATFRDRAI